MSKTMAEVDVVAQILWAKSHDMPWTAAADGFKQPYRRDASEILAALSAAGFGLVTDAKAEALRNAADTIETYAKDGADAEVSPYETAKWLRTRAAALRGDS